MRYCSVALLFCGSMLSIGLAGCALTATPPTSLDAAAAVEGSVHGGQQPIVGSHVYLLSAATNGYGQPSVSLLNAASTGQSDSIGAYVLSDAKGAFSISGDYSCTSGAQVYVFAQGGNPGAGVNSAASLMAVLGNCPATGTFATNTPFVFVDEISTVAAAYSFAGFALDSTHVSSSATTLAKTGVANAFANAANLANLATGAALSQTPLGNGTVPTSKINTIADILAPCINSTGPSSVGCTTLFANTKFGTLTPTDTATAAISIAHHPGSNVTALFNSMVPNSPYAPSLSSAPTDYTLTLAFPVTGGPGAVAVDSTGSVWIANFDNGSAAKLLPNGGPAPGSPFFDPSLNAPNEIAIDTSQNAWFVNEKGNTITKLSTSGTAASGSPSSGGGLNSPFSLAFDPTGALWVTNFNQNGVSKFTSAGVPVTGSPFIQAGLVSPFNVSVDAGDRAWFPDYQSNTVYELNPDGTQTHTTPFTGGGLSHPTSVAFDSSGNGWVVNDLSGTTTEILSGGGFGTGSPYSGGGQKNADYVAIDGTGTVWLADFSGLSALNADGTSATPSTGYTDKSIANITGIAIDGSGNIWMPNFSDPGGVVVEVIGVASPVVTPLAAAVANNTLASRP